MRSGNTSKPTGTKLRKTAEATLAERPFPEASPHCPELLHELRVHQIELEMQNNTLRQAQLALEESRDRYLDLYEFAPVGYLTLSTTGIITEINLTAVSLLATERKKLLGKNVRTLIERTDHDRWTQHFMAVKKQSEMSGVELKVLRGDGALIQAHLDCVQNDTSVRVTLSDITRQKQIEDELRIAAVAFASQNGMVITDPNAIIQRVNPAFIQLTGYNADEVIGKTPALLHSGRQDARFYLKMRNALKESGYWQGEIWNKHKNGNIYAVMLTISAIHSPDGIVTHFVGSSTDITQNKVAEAEIHRLAFYDPLTGLPNRRLLLDRLQQSVASAARSNLHGALFFIDLDRFKLLNDSRGHDVGDLLLAKVAQRLRESVREKDTVARQGGDEFVVLVEELARDPAEAAASAARIGAKLRDALSVPFCLNGYVYHCKNSIGCALFQGKHTITTLFKRADLALYEAKTSGRDRLRFFEPSMQQALERRNVLENALQYAILHDQLRLYYQPQVNHERKVVGVEALMRWEHPQRGLVLPDEFIPLAEDSGLILLIGRWALETACAQIKAWEHAPLTRQLPISVNVSARQFRQPDFAEQVEQILTASGANPARLKLELTESLVLDDVQSATETMMAIRRMGVSFSMDDFGTGYSSLSYLAKLPLDQLKVDKTFVHNLNGDAKDETIVRAIVTMGRGLNMSISAEGVETEAQQHFLQALGCQAYQGFLFSEPLPIEALEAYLRQATHSTSH
jgi:diguanylate cyclase (GGDEF)-like protein/PAS domain S-box-containing protein